MLSYRIHPELRLLLLTGTGHLSTDEILALQDEVRANPAFHPSFGILADYREITSNDFDRHNLLRIARNAPSGAGARRAFVMRGKLGFGLARMFEALSEAASASAASVRVFDDDLDAARRWVLGSEQH